MFYVESWLRLFQFRQPRIGFRVLNLYIGENSNGIKYFGTVMDSKVSFILTSRILETEIVGSDYRLLVHTANVR